MHGAHARNPSLRGICSSVLTIDTVESDSASIGPAMQYALDPQQAKGNHEQLVSL